VLNLGYVKYKYGSFKTEIKELLRKKEKFTQKINVARKKKDIYTQQERDFNLVLQQTKRNLAEYEDMITSNKFKT